MEKIYIFPDGISHIQEEAKNARWGKYRGKAMGFFPPMSWRQFCLPRWHTEEETLLPGAYLPEGAPDVILKKSGMNSSRTPPKITSLTFPQNIQDKKARGRLRNVFRIKETKDKHLSDAVVMLGHFLDLEKPVLEEPPLTHSTNLKILCIDENN